jgi:magnesium-transporting ATPase (P-type)
MIPEQDPDRHPRGPRTALKQGLIWLINFLGFVGIVLIFYGTVVYFTGEKYKYLEATAEGFANIATLFGVALTAASVWFPVNMREPEDFSRFIAAPLVVAAIIAVLILYVFPSVLIWFASWFGVQDSTVIPVHIFNGLAVLGLAGGLFRSISR